MADHEDIERIVRELRTANKTRNQVPAWCTIDDAAEALYQLMTENWKLRRTLSQIVGLAKDELESR